MIGRISGVVTEKLPDTLLVGVPPVEYELFVTTEDWGLAKVGEESRYYIYEQIREDAHNLFGFSELAAKQLFVQLLSVSGVGPKVALAVLSASSLMHLQQAIASGDSDLLKGTAGVGKKTAERIIVELKGKIDMGGFDPGSSGDAAYQALVGLGYSAMQASEVVAKLPPDLLDEKERIKAALKAAR